MHVITSARLKDFWNKHPNSETSLRLWNQRITKAEWQNFDELGQVYPSADKVGNLTVFNIGGNKYRLIVFIDYTRKKVFIRHVLTHAEYDKEDWKNDPWYT